jgi:hypothetical protein
MRINWLVGGYQLVSAGVFDQEQSGGAITLGVSCGYGGTANLNCSQATR